MNRSGKISIQKLNAVDNQEEQLEQFSFVKELTNNFMKTFTSPSSANKDATHLKSTLKPSKPVVLKVSYDMTKSACQFERELEEILDNWRKEIN